MDSARFADDEVLRRVRQDADADERALELERLSLAARGDSQGWKFNREELHEGD